MGELLGRRRRRRHLEIQVDLLAKELYLYKFSGQDPQHRMRGGIASDSDQANFLGTSTRYREYIGRGIIPKPAAALFSSQTWTVQNPSNVVHRFSLESESTLQVTSARIVRKSSTKKKARKRCSSA